MNDDELLFSEKDIGVEALLLPEENSDGAYDTALFVRSDDSLGGNFDIASGDASQDMIHHPSILYDNQGNDQSYLTTTTTATATTMMMMPFDSGMGSMTDDYLLFSTESNVINYQPSMNNMEQIINHPTNREMLSDASLSTAAETVTTKARPTVKKNPFNESVLPSPKKRQKMEPVKSEEKKENSCASSSSSSDESFSSLKKDHSSIKVESKRKRKLEEIDEDEIQLQRLNLIPLDELTEAEKKLKKKLRNRQSARRSRENKKHELQVAQELNVQLSNTCTKLKQEINELKARVQELQSENETLRKELHAAKNSNSIQFYANNNSSTSDNSDHIKQEEKGIWLQQVSPRKPVFLFSILFCIGFICFLTSLFPNSPHALSTTYKHAPVPVIKHEQIHYTHHHHQGMRLLASASNIEEKVYVETERAQEQKEARQSDKDDLGFNGDSMIKKQVFFPLPMKQHFYPPKIQSPAMASGKIGTELMSLTGTTSFVPRDFSLQNSLQLAMIPSALTSDSSSLFIFNQMKDKRLERGYTYQIPPEKNDEDSAIRLICPYIYPLISSQTNKNNVFSNNQSGEFTAKKMRDIKDKYLKLIIPVQTIDHSIGAGQPKRIIRMAEISARDITFDEIYLEFDNIL
jgi:hypothetical protein